MTLTIDPQLSNPPSRKTQRFHWVNVMGAVIFMIFLVPVVLHVFYQTSFSPVLTSSMQPEFSYGDLVFAQDVTASKIRLGDLVVIRDATTHELLAHRVVKISLSNGLLQMQTKGQENQNPDLGIVQISPDSTIPRTTGSLPQVGRAIGFLSSPTGKLLSGIALLLSALLFLIRFSHRRLVQRRASEAAINVHMENTGEQLL
ncbi:MAG: signal peptidase I [Actinomycetes bacterium]